MPHTEFRSAQPEDREIVLAFCTHTWDWGDYIERVWDDWLHDPKGQLLVATVESRPVGIIHLRMLNKIDAWLEGLRVDPNYRHQGIGTALDMAILSEAMRRGATHARFVTEFTNTAAISLAGRLHMRQVGGFALFTAQPVISPPRHKYGLEATQLATLDDLDDIIDYLNVSNVFPVVGGLYYVSFTGYVITAEFLQDKIAAQQIYLLRRWNRIDGLAIAEASEGRMGKRLSIGYIDGTTIEAISLIAYDLRRCLPSMGLGSVFVYAPDLVLVRDGLTGIEYEWDGKVFVTYERGLT